MLDITIYWKPQGQAPGKFEKHTAPYNDGWGDYIVQFAQDENNKDIWYLGVFEPRQDSDGRPMRGKWSRIKTLLSYKGKSQAGYFDWLEENVGAILVDGHEYWIAPEDSKEVIAHE